MEDTVRQFLNEVQRLVGEQQAQAAEVAALQKELQRARGGSTRMDLGRPPVFTGDEAVYEDWAIKLKAFMEQGSTTAVQWMCEMESAPDALDIDLYVEGKKKEAIGNQDGFEAYRRLAVRYAPRTLGRNLTRLTSIIDHDFGSDESQMLDKISAWERQIEEHERISGEKIADSVKCAVIQKGMPTALRTYLPQCFRLARSA
eukprot:504157-Amphidinium_carterae.1